MNQNDWSNLFNLLDSDNSGKIDLSELETLL
jgi:Ca2+-binding EF-hand superfamily protein